jgi:hypothetical protein
VGKPEGKRPLGRPRRRWVDNIRMDLGEVGWGDVNWIDLAKDRNRWRALVNSVLNLWVTYLRSLFFTLRRKYEIKVFETRVTMRIFWSKRSEVIGGKRKLHNEKLCKLYSFANANHMVKSKDDVELHGRADKCIELL